jgi:phosphatidylserine/phosphatidylglycerophosphate/cardiolipin synthase-like enzyme
MNGQEIQLELLADQEGYRRGLLPALRDARWQLWIGTANVKDVWVERGGWESITESLARLARKGVDVRILHSAEPSTRFHDRMECMGAERRGIKTRCCVRVHMKCVLVDGFRLYLGSANLTGAGIGAKGENKRNFEYAILTRDLQLVREVHRKFDRIWRGHYCAACKRRGICPSEER